MLFFVPFLLYIFAAEHPAYQPIPFPSFFLHCGGYNESLGITSSYLSLLYCNGQANVQLLQQRHMSTIAPGETVSSDYNHNLPRSILVQVHYYMVQVHYYMVCWWPYAGALFRRRASSSRSYGGRQCPMDRAFNLEVFLLIITICFIYCFC